MAPPGRVTFWSGAGISGDPPTQGPLGYALTDRSIEQVFEPAVLLEALLGAYAALDLTRTRPRLESVLDAAAAEHGLDETPSSSGYAFGASALVAGVMLTPFSAASFAARRPAAALARRASDNWVIAAVSVVLAAGQILFVLDRSGYLPVLATMALTGFGVGAVFAVNPLQIVEGVPANETGSSISFYQLIRTVGYSIASTLSATVLVGSTVARTGGLPSDAGYSTAAIADICVLGCAFATALLLHAESAQQHRRSIWFVGE